MPMELERTISEAFSAIPLGKPLRELRRLWSAIDGDSRLDHVNDREQLVGALLADADGEFAGQIMFLDGEAWRALVPTWMIASIRSGGRVSGVFGSVLASLDPGFAPKASEVMVDRISGLTPPERAAIAEFVGWATRQATMIQDHNAKDEIERLRKEWPSASKTDTVTTAP